MVHFLRLHETPDAFRQALNFTEAETGFAQRLIEKDFFCSLILADFDPLFSSGLVFKGGTSLSKVHASFYRLSEDLDFAISVPTTTRRSVRRGAVALVKQHLKDIEERMPSVSVIAPLRGHDESRQYNATLRYESAITGQPETVKLQVAIREPIIEPTMTCSARTLLRQPLTEQGRAEGLTLRVLSLRETYAEKVRAALTRIPPAIRDIFDIAEAVRAKRLDLIEPVFLNLVRQKLAVPGNSPVDTSQTRRESLVSQLDTNLKPVLRSSDYEAFDIDRAFAEVETIAAMIRGD
jgi:predicted nucleotidyltransferase component of viral defense system